MMLLTFTFRFKLKSPYFLHFIFFDGSEAGTLPTTQDKEQPTCHPITWGKNEMKRNDDFYNRGISVSFFFLTPNKTMTLKGYDISASFVSQNSGNMHKYLSTI